MKLISLKLLHFRRFRKEEIYFKDDFSLIFGRNGAGKSTILDAIGFALFGPSSKDFVRINTSLLRSDFLRDREPSKIELTFQLGLDEYRIVRIIDAGTKKFASDFIVESKDSMFGPNGLEIIGGGEVTNEIIRLIGISRDTFLRSVFAKQKDLEVLSGPREDRKKLINSILGLDKIEYKIMDIKRGVKYDKTRLEILKKEVETFDIDEVQKNISTIKGIIKSLENDIKSTNKEIASLSNDLQVKKELKDKKEQEKQLHQSLESNIKLLNNTLDNTKKNITSLESDLEEIKKAEKFLNNHENIINKETELSKKLQDLRNAKKDFEYKESLQKELKDIQDRLEKLQIQKDKEVVNIDDIKKLQEDLKKLNQSIKNTYGEIQKIIQEQEGIIKKGKELDAELEQIKSLGNSSNCPTCKRPLEDYLPNLIELYQKSLGEKRQEYKELQIKKSLVEKDINNLEQDYSKKEKSLKELGLKQEQSIKAEADLKNLHSLIEEKKQKLISYKDVKYSHDEFLSLEKEYLETRKIYDEYMSLKSIVSKKELILSQIKDKNDLLSKSQDSIDKNLLDLKSLGFDDKVYQDLKKQYDDIFSKKDIFLEKLNSLEKEKIKQEYELKSSQKLIDDNKENKKQIDEIVEKIDYDEIKINVLSDYLIYLLDYLKPHIEDLASSYFTTITDNKYSQITLDSDYNIEIDGKSIELYSGGEKDLANLCLRLSLGQNLNSGNSSLNFLVLDEVLGSQDKDRQQNILINLKKLENKFSQILLISHLEEIKELSTNLIEVRSLNDSESEIVTH